MEKESVDISIPAALYEKVEEKIKGSDIGSVQDYVVKVVQESLPATEEKEETLSKEEEDKVKERLKALGYMD
ncbi:MAG: CopG family transcriptional regulator [Candidatus Aminicenantes bacterium]|nr:CopG family transcriptional regulator [Candidatus Aminicenantes bacterium]